MFRYSQLKISVEQVDRGDARVLTVRYVRMWDSKVVTMHRRSQPAHSALPPQLHSITLSRVIVLLGWSLTSDKKLFTHARANEYYALPIIFSSFKERGNTTLVHEVVDEGVTYVRRDGNGALFSCHFRLSRLIRNQAASHQQKIGVENVRWKSNSPVPDMSRHLCSRPSEKINAVDVNRYEQSRLNRTFSTSIFS